MLTSSQHQDDLRSRLIPLVVKQVVAGCFQMASGRPQTRSGVIAARAGIRQAIAIVRPGRCSPLSSPALLSSPLCDLLSPSVALSTLSSIPSSSLSPIQAAIVRFGRPSSERTKQYKRRKTCTFSCPRRRVTTQCYAPIYSSSFDGLMAYRGSFQRTRRPRRFERGSLRPRLGFVAPHSPSFITPV